MRMFDRLLTTGLADRPFTPKPAEPLTEAEVEARVTAYLAEQGGNPAKALDALKGDRDEALRTVRKIDKDLHRNLRDLRAARRDQRDAMRRLAANPLHGVFQVDNVAAYTTQFPTIDLYELPSIAPARPSSWFEWAGAGAAKWRLGAWVRSRRSDEDWTVTVDLYWEVGKKVFGPIETHTLHLDDRGRLASDDFEPIEAPAPDGYSGGEFLVVLQSLAFLHCRNVETDPVPVAPKVAMRHQKLHGIGPTQFQTIRLRVPRKGGAGGDGEGGHDGRSLHIVDGHFAHYGSCCDNHPPKGLLFGKYEGVYWVEAHARGNAARGQVISARELVTEVSEAAS